MENSLVPGLHIVPPDCYPLFIGGKRCLRYITQILVRCAFVLAIGFGLLLFRILGRIA